MKSWIIYLTDPDEHPVIIQEIPVVAARKRDPDEGDCYVYTREHYVEVFSPSWVTGNDWKRWIFPWHRIRSIEMRDDRRDD
jgi:hypothetical protein